MRKRTLVLAVSTLAAAGAATGIVAAQADAPSAAGRTQFTVVERALTDTTGDVPPRGDSLGDVLAFRNPIYNAADTARVGTDNGSCVRTRVAYSYECTWTVQLSGGALVVTGPFYDTSDSVLAVTGGTGRYFGARGSMSLHARDAAGSEYDFGFSLLST